MLNLHAEDVLYIKYVDNFFPERRNFCGADPQPKFRQSPRQVIQQSGPIAPIYLDHGPGIRGFVVDQHTRRDGKNFRTARQALHFFEFYICSYFTGNRFLNNLQDTVQFCRLVRRRRIAVLKPKTIERHAIV